MISIQVTNRNRPFITKRKDSCSEVKVVIHSKELFKLNTAIRNKVTEKKVVGNCLRLSICAF